MMFRKSNGKYNYINFDCEEVFKKDFDLGDGFRGGYAVVTEDGVQKIINSSGEEVLNCSEYESIGNCGCSRFFVHKGNEVFLIDEKGNKITDVYFETGQTFRYTPG